MTSGWADDIEDLLGKHAPKQGAGVDHGIDATNKISGATIDIIDQGNGDYLVQQIVPAQAPAQPVHGDHSLSWSFGPLTLTGTVNSNSYAISVNISILGISLGGFSGNLKDGLAIKVNLVAVKGEVKFYLRAGNEVWVYLQLKVIFDGSYDTSHKLITI